MANRLGDKIVLRAEMTVESAVRQTGGLHHLGHADGIEPFLAEQSAGDIQDPIAILRHLLSTDLHFKYLRRPH